MENIICNFKLPDGSLVACDFYDTNGTERYRAVNESYYKKVDGCIIIYDITNSKSFDIIEEYFIPKIQEKCINNIPVFILGNKTDMNSERKISVEQGKRLASIYKYYFDEISSIEKININEIFQIIIIKIKEFVKNRGPNNNDDILRIRINPQERNNRCFRCC